MNQSKDIFARLLANENISIRRGNYRTAFFDIEKRELGIPLWKDISKDEEDLFIGHEVGHALETPLNGWHDSVTTLPIPRSFVNVVEDIRIERKVQSKYPGLVSSFKRGYLGLLRRDFFGLSTLGEPNELSLIDRLNLKSKLRDHINIKFSPEEQPLVDQAMRVETFEDVIDACIAIHDFMKLEKEDQKDTDVSWQMPELGEEGEEMEIEMGESDDPSTPGDSLPQEDPNDQSSSEETDKESEESSGSSESQSPGDSETDKNEEEEMSSGEEGGEQPEEEFESLTDNAFRENEKKLTETKEGERQSCFIQPMTLERAKIAIIPYSRIKRSREKRMVEFQGVEIVDRIKAEYQPFLNETSKAVGLLLKEFEMRKAAYRFSRAKESKSGTLNLNKIHSYKYNEDIFNRVTALADSKSHGMIMLIDYSGSMNEDLSDVIKQLLNLVMFCKKANIPFQVYGFTSRHREFTNINIELRDGEIDPREFKLLDLINSNMDRATYNEAYFGLYTQSRSSYLRSSAEWLGSTPMNESLMALELLSKELHKKWGVQKMNLIVLSDGLPSGIQIHRNTDWGWHKKYKFMVNGKVIENKEDDIYPTLIEGFNQRGYNTVGIFIGSKSHICHEIRKSEGYSIQSDDLVKNFRKIGSYAKKGHMNYNDYIFMDSCKMDTDNDEMDIDVNASKAKIISEFKKFSSSKKNNRFLAVRFAEAIS